MPYFNLETQPQAVKTESFWRFHDTSAGIFSGERHVFNQTIPSTDFLHIMRAGENTNSPLDRLFHGKVPKLIAYRRTIGYRWGYKRVKKEYRDKRGRIRYKWTYERRRYPIRIRAVRMVSGASSLISKEYVKKAAFLKPNRLDFRVESSSLKPNKLPVFFKLDLPTNDHVFHEGHAICEGVGLHFIETYNPYYNPVIRIGSNLDSAGFNPCPENFLAEQAALYKLYEKVSSDIPEYMTALAETPELIKFLKETFSEGLKLIREIKKLDVKRLAGRLSSNLSAKGLSNLWLQWTYAISPVISDVQGTMQVIASRERIWRSFSASVKIQQANEGDNATPGYFYGKSLVTNEDIYRYGIILEGKLHIGSYIQQRVNNAIEVAATTYELVPYSFMLDWVNDIGGYLTSCSVIDNQKYVAWITRMRKHYELWDGSFGPDRYSPSVLWSPPFVASRSLVSCQRYPLSVLPDMPNPIFKRHAKLLDDAVLRRALNATAIFVQQYKGFNSLIRRP